VSTSSPTLPEAGILQLEYAGHFESVSGERGGWLAFPAGRHAAHAGQHQSVSVCAVVRDAGAALEVRLADVLTVAPEDAQIVVVDGGSTDWTLSHCLRIAAGDERVVVYQPAAAGERSDDALALDALSLAAAPLALLVPADGRVSRDVVTVLHGVLDAMPAAAAVCAAGLSQLPGAEPRVHAPWCGTGYRHGADAAAALIAVPDAVLLARPLLVRTDALAMRSASLREALLRLCAGADVVGVEQPLNLQAGPDLPCDGSPAALARAIAIADLVPAVLPDAVAVHAAVRALAGALADLPEPDPAALKATADGLRRLAGAAIAPVAGAVDTRRFNPGVPPLPLSLRDFCFLCVFAAPGPELEAVIRAYVTAFGPADPVSLLLRPDGPDAGDVESWLVELLTGPLGRSLEEIPDLLVETARLEPGDLPALYATGDCFVALAAGDPLEAQRAMACGVPVIAAGESGLEERMRDAAADPAGCGRAGARARGLVMRSALGLPA
jgi:hypothetical protein